MSEAETDTTVLPPPVRRGHPLLAWLVVGLVVAFILYRNASVEVVEREHFDRVTTELQGRYIVGVGGLFRQDNKEALLRQAETAEDRGYEQRLCSAVLAGELAGPEEALRRLRQLTPAEGDDTETAEALTEIYRAAVEKPPAPPPAAAVERARAKLGWFGKLAAVAPGTADTEAREVVLREARRTAVVSLSVIACFLMGIAVGLATLVVVAALAWSGVLRPRLATGSPYGGVYAETFAVWFVLFLALGFAGHFIPAGSSRLLLSGLLSLVSLAALAWPVARGVPWSAVRYDVGLGGGRRPAVEVLNGFGTYAVAIPLLAGGAALMFLLISVAKKFGYTSSPGHPLAPFVAGSGAWGRVQAFIVAAVVAPIVEETMFRGVLYRHLREWSAGLGRVVSVLASAVLVSFVFAVIHPQGWFGVPPLMGLALAFCLAREMRNTLLPAMVAHALQNGIITTVLIIST